MNDIPREPEADTPESGNLVDAGAADDGPHPAAASPSRKRATQLRCAAARREPRPPGGSLGQDGPLPGFGRRSMPEQIFPRRA